MYQLYFYLCLLASVGMTVTLVLLAIFPVPLPLSEDFPPRRKLRPRQARSPTPRATTYWPDWDDDEADL